MAKPRQCRGFFLHLISMLPRQGQKAITVDITTLLDRPLHHSHVLALQGESYRLKTKCEAGVLPLFKEVGTSI